MIDILLTIVGFILGVCAFVTIAFGVGFVIDWYDHGR